MLEGENTHSKPDLQSYLDVRQYLQEYYEWRKEEFTGFSYASWAKELGFQSRTFLRLVVVGKRNITERSIPKFQKSLKLTQKEQSYFLNLVRFSQAPTAERREYYAKFLQKKISGTSSTIIADHYQFLSSSTGPKLMALLTMKDVPWTKERIHSHLGVPMRVLSTWLLTLERLGLAQQIKETESVRWIATISRFKVPEKIGDLALKSFHRKSLEHAITAIDEESDRRYRALYVPLSKDEFNEIQETVQQFIDDILDKYLTDEGQNRRLYQMNLNLIPVSNPILHSDVCLSESVGLNKKKQTKGIDQ